VLRSGWREVGGFLGGSIRAFWRRYPLERQLELWRAAGVRDVAARRLSLGGGVVVWGTRE
jgi:demethylmenaquinone methyltransferase/2-methoxy-6-polyprenyl-1,4-benzoquinol methylase